MNELCRNISKTKGDYHRGSEQYHNGNLPSKKQTIAMQRIGHEKYPPWYCVPSLKCIGIEKWSKENEINAMIDMIDMNSMMVASVPELLQMIV